MSIFVTTYIPYMKRFISTKALVITILTLLCQSAEAERVTLDFFYDGLFDNREYKNDMLPQTIYGMRFTPVAGIRHDGHEIMFGTSKIWEYGSSESIKPDVIMFYNFRGDHFDFTFGSFPRKRLQRQLPGFMLYDSIAYFNPQIQGTMFGYRNGGFSSELYCNWYGRQSETTREAFRIVWDGAMEYGNFSAGWFSAMTHHAKPKAPGYFIYDQIQFYPYISYQSGPLTQAGIRLSLDAGLAMTGVRKREIDKSDLNMGFLGHGNLTWKKIHVNTLVYSGNRMQPYLHDPEAGIMFHRADPFYNHKLYTKTCIGITFYEDRFVRFGFDWNIHTTDKTLHNQQMIKVNYTFNPEMIDRTGR